MRVLMLSLGKGQDKDNEKVYVYRNAFYRLNDRIYQSPFVADALIHEYSPDAIMVIGSVRSAWYDFYAKYHAGDDIDSEKWQRLCDGTKSNGLNSSDEEIASFERFINDIFSDDVEIMDSRGKKVLICAVVIRYGLSKKEMEYNYSRILTQWERFPGSQDETMHVAVDITHSFRSMPIYNLAVLNYYRLLSNKQISISHVYYGNIEVAFENQQSISEFFVYGNAVMEDGIAYHTADEDKKLKRVIIDRKEHMAGYEAPVAEIVDLIDLVDIIDLTAGVNELKSTGSTFSLSRLVEDNRIKGILRSFDWATQVNDYRLLDEAADQIITVCNEDNKLNRKDNLIPILKTVIFEKLGCKTSEEWNALLLPEKQLRIGKWFLGQERYGMACLIGCEALRSQLVRIYKKPDGSFIDREDWVKEESRRASYNWLTNLLLKELNQKLNLTQEELFWRDTAEIAKKAQNIRNIMAHNLGARDVVPVVLEDDAKRTIQALYDRTEEINSKNRDEVFRKAFYIERTKKVNVEVTVFHRKTRILVYNSFDSKKMGKMSRNSKGDKFILKRISEPVERILNGDRKKENPDAAKVLFDHLKINRVFDSGSDNFVSIVFVEMSLRQKLNYYAYFNYCFLKENIKTRLYDASLKNVNMLIIPRTHHAPKSVFFDEIEMQKDYYDVIHTPLMDFLP